MKALSLPTNDLDFAAYPQRGPEAVVPLWASRMNFAGSRPATKISLPAELERTFAEDAPVCKHLSNAQLAQRVRLLGVRLRKLGLTPPLAGSALAAVSEMMARQVQQRPFPQQILAAWYLLRGHLIEMQTGEGKSLAAGLAAAVAGAAGSSVFVLTANDYLVERDMRFLKPLFDALGLSSAVVTSLTPAQDRPSYWRAGIVYSTARELGFDYLRDHVRFGGSRDPVQNRAAQIARQAQASTDRTNKPASTEMMTLAGLCFCIVDEADALLLDEAGVPLILATAGAGVDIASLRNAFEAARKLRRGQDFRLDPDRRRAHLTATGLAHVERILGERDGALSLWQRAIELVETALCALLLYRCNRDYSIVNGEVALIDEFTGRIASGRQWQGPLQSLVEIKEALEPKAPTQVTAQITFQDLFPRFMRLSGMSGTVIDAHRELKAVYGLSVVRVPLRKRCANRNLGWQVFAAPAARQSAAVEQIEHQQKRGRPVLVATDSVDESLRLASVLKRAGIRHQCLNAIDCANEAAALERAGRASVVTVTTNLAGRGTDIRLSDVARRNGGLCVIAMMANRSRRIDRQLYGRAGRQGDPGSFQAMLSLQDRLFIKTLSPTLLVAIGWLHRSTGGRPQLVFTGLARVCQAISEARDRAARLHLRSVSRERLTRLGFAGHPE